MEYAEIYLYIKMSNISNKQDIVGMQGIFNSNKVDKKRNLEDEFIGNARLAKIDKDLDTLRRKLNESMRDSESGDESGSVNSGSKLSSTSSIKSSIKGR